MKKAAVIALLLSPIFAAQAGLGKEPVLPFESREDPAPGNFIDDIVGKQLRQLKIEPSRACSDAVFVRRIYLDTIGTVPTLEEARRFLLDRSPDKRKALIDQLLAREEFAAYWAMKWCDMLRVKSEFPINLWPNAVQAYHRWIRTSLAANMPFDQFSRELLTANGSNFRVPQVNFYRAVQGQDAQTIATAVALTFMGARFDTWPKDRQAGMAAFFSGIKHKNTGEWKEEILFADLFDTSGTAAANRPTEAIFPDGVPVKLAPDQDARAVFADWLITPENPWFAKNAVNRVWFWLFGRGIVHEPDDIRQGNPAANPELLSRLEREFVASKFDLKQVYRMILNSKAYQRSSIPATENPDAEKYFAVYPIRRLDAEVLIDAICQITGSPDEYSSLIPEPFTFIPQGERAIELADGSISSSFLELFGRPPRDTGFASERNNQPTPAQSLHLLNSSHIRRKIEGSQKLRPILFGQRDPEQTIAGIYLTVLSRFPTTGELATIQDYSTTAEAKGPNALIDVTWALMNSTEFLYRH